MLESDEDLEEYLSNFVSDEALDELHAEVYGTVRNGLERGGPKVAVGLGLSELNYTQEEAAEITGVSRRAIYDARKDLDLEIESARGKHK